MLLYCPKMVTPLWRRFDYTRSNLLDTTECNKSKLKVKLIKLSGLAMWMWGLREVFTDLAIFKGSLSIGQNVNIFIVLNCQILKNNLAKWAIPAPFSFITAFFYLTIQFLQPINVNNVHPVNRFGI